MKKIMSLMLGLSLVIGAATIAFAGQDTGTKKTSTKKSTKKKSTKSTT